MLDNECTVAERRFSVFSIGFIPVHFCTFVHRIFIVDDHPTIRRIYAEAIAETDDLDVCGVAASFAEALQALPEAQPDLALVDLSLGRDAPSGLELIGRLSNEAQNWLVMSVHDDPFTAQRVLASGADEFLSKRKAGDALLQTIRKVLST